MTDDENEVTEMTGEDKNQYHCDECGADFTSDKQFHSHRQSHASRGTKSQICPECKEEFESEEEWQKHKGMHRVMTD